LEQSKYPTIFRYLLPLLGLLLAVLPMVGCQTADEGAEAEVAAAEVEPVVEEATAVPTPVPTEEVETVATEPEPIDYCLECHVDKDMLIDTADPEEEVIKENEGEG
jgi:hypothetical protein